MIGNLSIKNFKAFKEINNLSIKPLTVICGINSSGKTSLLKSLLVLKQSLSIDNEDSAMSFNGPYLYSSGLSDLFFAFSDSQKVQYSFSCMNNKIKVDITFSMGNKTGSEVIVENFKMNVPIPQENKKEKRKYFELKYERENHYTINTNLKDSEIIDSSNDTSSKEVNFSGFIPHTISFTPEELKEGEKATIKMGLPFIFLFDDNFYLHRAIQHFRGCFTNMSYLGPIRAQPRRAYVQYSDFHACLDADGANVAQVLWLKKDHKVTFAGKSLKLSDAVAKCLEVVGIKHQITPRRDKSIIYSLDVSLDEHSDHKVTIADVGFGVSQLLPVILICLLSKKGESILLEQPEIHLHSSCQSKLADLFVQFMNDGKQIILETHSVDFINRLRLLVLEQPKLNDKLNIVFVSPGKDIKDGAQITQFTIDENGSPIEWPEGFCDESQKTIKDIIRARAFKK